MILNFAANFLDELHALIEVLQAIDCEDQEDFDILGVPCRNFCFQKHIQPLLRTTLQHPLTAETPKVHNIRYGWPNNSSTAGLPSCLTCTTCKAGQTTDCQAAGPRTSDCHKSYEFVKQNPDWVVGLQRLTITRIHFRILTGDYRPNGPPENHEIFISAGHLLEQPQTSMPLWAFPYQVPGKLRRHYKRHHRLTPHFDDKHMPVFRYFRPNFHQVYHERNLSKHWPKANSHGKRMAAGFVTLLLN